ncbi:MAG: hypothetical protein VB085_02630 [Peptococcaceae bacterium]|nr:hypothetical protein [Peptococcaceae bacterium]
MAGKEKFRVSDSLRNKIVVFSFVVTALLHGLVLREQSQRYLALVILGAVTVGMSAAYMITNWPLGKKNLYVDLILDAVIIGAVLRFMALM